MMKKYLTIIFLSLISISCNDDFEPNAPFRERFSLNAIIRSDTTMQLLTLFRSYEVEGTDPFHNSEYPFIRNADVKMWHNNKLYQFKDSSIIRNDTSRYKTPVHAYYNNEFKPQAGETIEVEALLPNGFLLQSITTLPDLTNFNYLGSDINFPPGIKDQLYFQWNRVADGTMFHPRLLVKYYYKVDQKLYTKEIPIRFLGNGEPLYPMTSTNQVVIYEMNSIVKTLQNISANDTNKDNFSITEIVLQVMIFDVNLSTYYSSGSEFQDDFTVKLDQPDFSNIQGGFGIFGSFSISNYSLELSREYINSLGYTAGF